MRAVEWHMLPHSLLGSKAAALIIQMAYLKGIKALLCYLSYFLKILYFWIPSGWTPFVISHVACNTAIVWYMFLLATLYFL